ncbi:MAG: DUF2179 domain-containing protein [Anaerolineales bacterium]|nr:DUF2179 domain-containing protein [Anaerolineales bacterium]
MEVLLSPAAWLAALLIFFLRVIDTALATLRMIYVMRGRKWVSWMLGFAQSILFVMAITVVLSDLDNVLNVIGYAAGFATGGLFGMVIEEKLAVGHTHLQIVSPHNGARLVDMLREGGFAVTEIPARGKDGVVHLLSCYVLRKDISKVKEIINRVDEDAFVTSEDVTPVRRGYWRA